MVHEISYDASGRIETMTFGNGIATTVRHDARGKTREIAAEGIADLGSCR